MKQPQNIDELFDELVAFYVAIIKDLTPNAIAEALRQAGIVPTQDQPIIEEPAPEPEPFAYVPQVGDKLVRIDERTGRRNEVYITAISPEGDISLNKCVRFKPAGKNSVVRIPAHLVGQFLMVYRPERVCG
jgi:hypothetical protein